MQGKGCYSDDVRHAGETHACVLRSPHAHALIRGIDTAAALHLPGDALIELDLRTRLRRHVPLRIVVRLFRSGCGLP